MRLRGQTAARSGNGSGAPCVLARAGAPVMKPDRAWQSDTCLCNAEAPASVGAASVGAGSVGRAQALAARDRGLAPALRSVLALLFVASLLPACQKPPELDDLGTLPAWHLTDQTGAALGSDTLRGKPWVANFLFTSCPTSCPPLARATARLQERIRAWQPKDGPPLARIVSISVDPETDTPARLTEWGKQYHVDPRLWLQATGPYEAMETLVVGGFMQPIIRNDRQPGQPPPAAPTPMDTAHSLRFVLVDANGHLRGLFEQDDAALAKLDAALQQLAEVRHE